MTEQRIENVTENIPTDRALTAPKNTPFETIVKLKEKYPNISAKNLGKLVGISPQAVIQMFGRHGINFKTGQVTALEEYKINRADIFAVKQIECLEHIDHARLKKASARDLAIVLGTLYDKERLERGQSTNNTSVFFHVVGEAPDLPGDAMPVDNSDTMSICSGAAPVDKSSS